MKWLASYPRRLHDRLAAPFEPLVKDIVFTRIPAGDCLDPAFRQHCTGTFISQGITTVVVGQDNDGQLT